MASIPLRLSEHQKFVLAYLAVNDGNTLPWPEHQGVWPTSVSRALAEEYDRYTTNSVPRYRPGSRPKVVTEEHAAAFSRTLDRLEDRGLIDSYIPYRRQQRRRVSLTESGREAAEEILRRHRDGRYSLSFDTLDTETDD